MRHRPAYKRCKLQEKKKGVSTGSEGVSTGSEGVSTGSKNKQYSVHKQYRRWCESSLCCGLTGKKCNWRTKADISQNGLPCAQKDITPGFSVFIEKWVWPNILGSILKIN